MGGNHVPYHSQTHLRPSVHSSDSFDRPGRRLWCDRGRKRGDLDPASAGSQCNNFTGGHIGPGTHKYANPPPAVVLVCPNNQRVELSVLVEPLDTGNVELAGSVILTNGGATSVCKDDQINIIARANDGWRFDHWELDVTGTRATQVIVMTTSKKVRAIFVRIDERTIVPPAFYKLTVNGTDVTNAVTGLTDGAVKVSPAPGTGELPYAQGTVVALTAQPAIGYELDHWGIDCSGSEPCVLTMDRNRSVEAIFRLKD